MKAKTHSGAKKRIKVKKSRKTGINLFVEKSCRRHLLQNKSKGQKAMGKTAIKVDSTKKQAVKRMLNV